MGSRGGGGGTQGRAWGGAVALRPWCDATQETEAKDPRKATRSQSLRRSSQVKTQASLADKFDFSAAERCYQWEECGMLKPFVDAHKPIFAHEYALAPTGTSSDQCIKVVRSDSFCLIF